MLSHTQIWYGIDELARRRGLTASGLARLAGLDPTTFNKSKRVAANGAKLRWPSTESVAKALEATGVSFPEFAALAVADAVTPSVPLLDLAAARDGDHFDAAGRPVGAAWNRLPIHAAPEGEAFAIAVTDTAWSPPYQPGDHIIAAVGGAPSPGDRALAHVRADGLVAGALTEIRGDIVTLAPFGDMAPARMLNVDQIAWLARILWASQ